MTYVNNDGIRINYEIVGDSTNLPLVLQHGTSGDLNTWRDRGFVERLVDRYLLVLIDARAQGRAISRMMSSRSRRLKGHPM